MGLTEKVIGGALGFYGALELINNNILDSSVFANSTSFVDNMNTALLTMTGYVSAGAIAGAYLTNYLARKIVG